MKSKSAYNRNLTLAVTLQASEGGPKKPDTSERKLRDARPGRRVWRCIYYSRSVERPLKGLLVKLWTRLLVGGITSTATTAAIPREPQLLGPAVVVIGGTADIGLETARRAAPQKIRRKLQEAQVRA